jgi:hypothetical protein
MEEIHAAGRKKQLRRISAKWPPVQRHQTTFFLGHSLRSHYEDVIKEPTPDRLQALAEQLERRAFFDAQYEIKSE